MGSRLQCPPARTRPCITCHQLSLKAKSTRRTAAADELWHIEARRVIGLIEWVIRLAEATFDRFRGFETSTEHDLNKRLAEAIEHAGADVEARRKEADAYYAWTHGDDTVSGLANAIAVRLGETPRSVWNSDLLGALAARVHRR